MELVDNLGLGLSTALSPQNLLFALIGVILGTAVGVLPGIGPTATIALLLPVTFTLEPATALIMLAGIYYGAQYGGSTTAILINLPGESSAAVTAIDGHEMARKGRAGPALATAAIGSFIAGSVATVVIVLFAPPLARVALTFGSAEFFSLVVLGLIASITLARGSAVKALAMIVLGLLFATIGQDQTGTPRFTFGVRELFQGVNFVSVAVGMFGVAEILRNLEDEKTRKLVTKKISGLWPTREDLRRMRGPIARGTVLGSALGILPGAGHVLASFGSYAMEKRLARKHRAEFGHGAIEGVAGPESANNAAAQTSFIPLLTLGLPAHPVMALMIGALIIHGIQPGPNVINTQPALFWGLIVSMWIGNLFLLLLNLPLIGIWVRMLTIPYKILFPVIIAFSAIGTFSLGLNAWNVFAIAFFGILGYALTKLGCEPAPLLLGFILGPLLEDHLRRALIISRGDPSIFINRPVSAVLLALAVGAIILAVLPAIRQRREVVFKEEEV